MKNLKVIKNNELKDWAKEIFKKNSFNMVDVSAKKETHRRALASGKIYVGKEVFNLIKNKEMPKGDPVALAEVSAVLGVKKTSELIPLCHPLPIDHTATKIIMNDEENRKIFSENRDPFKDFEIRMCIICDLEQGGKLYEEEAFKKVKQLYKEFKKYYKENVKDGS